MQNNTKIIEIFDNKYSDEVKFISKNLKEADRIEVMASSGMLFPCFIALKGWEMSTRKWIIMRRDEPVAMFGVVAHDKYPKTGVPWLLSTASIQHIKRFLIKSSEKYISEMKKTYSYLFNYVDERNKFSIRWLSWCGFNIHEAQPKGALGLNFHLFDMGVRPNV